MTTKKDSGAKGADSKADIKIGAIFDLSGATADVGNPYSEGSAPTSIKNAAGGVEGHKIALRWQDYELQGPHTAEQLYQQYVSEGAMVFMGWGTADTEALRPR